MLFIAVSHLGGKKKKKRKRMKTWKRGIDEEGVLVSELANRLVKGLVGL